jgi:hypothetical protein
VPLGALLVSWAVGWSIGMVVILATMFALSFGGAFWWLGRLAGTTTPGTSSGTFNTVTLAILAQDSALPDTATIFRRRSQTKANVSLCNQSDYSRALSISIENAPALSSSVESEEYTKGDDRSSRIMSWFLFFIQMHCSTRLSCTSMSMLLRN